MLNIYVCVYVCNYSAVTFRPDTRCGAQNRIILFGKKKKLVYIYFPNSSNNNDCMRMVIA